MTTTTAEIRELAWNAGYNILPMAENDRDVLRALNDALWAAIREQDERIPAVAWSLQPGRSSSCDGVTWTSPAPVLVVNLKDPEGKKLPAKAVLEFLLHQAAHAVAGTARGAEGRYHSADFKDAAIRLGLVVADPPLPGNGYVPTGLARGSLTRYDLQVRAVEKALRAWNPVELRKRDRGPVGFACKCDPPRRLRTNAGVAAKGPIICGLCGQRFELVTPPGS